MTRFSSCFVGPIANVGETTSKAAGPTWKKAASRQETCHAHDSKQKACTSGNGRGRATYMAVPMDLYMAQRTAGWIGAALIVCHGLSAQTGIRPGQELREDTVTLQELRHSVPRRAQAEMAKAERAKLKHQLDRKSVV